MSTSSPAQRPPGSDKLRWNETLRDGTGIVIRPITALDAAAERAFIDGLSPRARFFRFLGQISHPTSALISQFTDIDFTHEVAFAAVAQGPDAGFLGVSRYSTSPDGASCECAVSVLDAWHNKGIGSALMRHLIEVARSRGILYMFSIDRAENTDMAELAQFLGFERKLDPADATQVVHSLWL